MAVQGFNEMVFKTYFILEIWIVSFISCFYHQVLAECIGKIGTVNINLKQGPTIELLKL